MENHSNSPSDIHCVLLQILASHPVSVLMAQRNKMERYARRGRLTLFNMKGQDRSRHDDAVENIQSSHLEFQHKLRSNSANMSLYPDKPVRQNELLALY